MQPLLKASANEQSYASQSIHRTWDEAPGIIFLAKKSHSIRKKEKKMYVYVLFIVNYLFQDKLKSKSFCQNVFIQVFLLWFFQKN